MSTGYSSGMRRNRITIQNRKAATASKYGLDATDIEWEDCATVWAAVDFVKGMRAMREGAIDVYGVVMVRMNWNCIITMRSRIVHDGNTYQILPETFHADRAGNTIQFNAQVVINDQQ